jgi:tRNA threonylcarbamoyladenosine biosynthesis protein TsaB
MIILALDTALESCTAAVANAEQTLAYRSEPMARGHQERLAPLVAEVMTEAGVAFRDLDRIGVTVGPGSFTGLRVGLAFAKGLGLSLGRPVVGVGTLQAMAGQAKGLTVVAIDARREQLYLQILRDGAPLTAPEAVTLEDAVSTVSRHGPPDRLIGSGARLLAGAFPQTAIEQGNGAAVETLVALARAADPERSRAAPLYLRAPDAKLPASALA